MAEEVEKKYRLTAAEREQTLQKLETSGAKYEGEDFEENTLFRGGILNLKPCILRLRKTQDKSVLTYKEVLPSENAIKRRKEIETIVADGAAMHEILENLGYKPALVYEKRRKIFQFGAVEIVVDELPFGFFLEIEGAENEILAAEIKLGLENLPAEHEPYPALTTKFGAKNGNLIEARFLSEKD